MFNLFGKNDAQLREDVVEELEWDPSVSAREIVPTVEHGVVILRGIVPRYSEKKSAEDAAQRVGGVRAVVDEIDVIVPSTHQQSDGNIAEAALMALRWSALVPQGIQAVVENGWVTLSGEAKWDYERCAAKQAVSVLKGVRGVTSKISIISQVIPADVRSRIAQAFRRSANRAGSKIDVQVDSGNVTLSGSLHSNAEISAAQTAAWRAPGVTSVTNTMLITPSRSALSGYPGRFKTSR